MVPRSHMGLLTSQSLKEMTLDGSYNRSRAREVFNGINFLRIV